MKKLIIKTIVFALAIILAISFVVVTILSTCFPSVIANGAFRLNNKEICVKYTEKQYLKSNEFNDLALLVERSIWADNDEITVKYAQDFLSDENFEAYAINQGKSYTSYVAANYVLSLYDINNVDKSIATAFQYSDENFSLPNPITNLVYTATIESDKETLSKILDRLYTMPQNENVLEVINQILFVL